MMQDERYDKEEEEGLCIDLNETVLNNNNVNNNIIHSMAHISGSGYSKLRSLLCIKCGKSTH